jgi:hypothetical protein
MSVNGPDLCPLCGESNACGMAAGQGTCWCFTASVPAEVIERIPAEQRDRACVCRACASKVAQAEDSSGVPPVAPG